MAGTKTATDLASPGGTFAAGSGEMPSEEEPEPGNPMELEFDDSDNSGLVPLTLWW